MTYVKQSWIDSQTPVDKVHMDHIEDGVVLLDTGGAAAKGAANGYASLDAGGKVPVAQIPLTVVSYATTLPASPVDGQEAILVDSVTNPTCQWRFRWNAGSSSAYKWEFVGGHPSCQDLYADVIVTNAWTVMASPQFTVPRAGVYRARAYAQQVASGTGGGTIFTFGAGLTTDANGGTYTANAANAAASSALGLSPAMTSITCAAGNTICIWAHGGASGVHYYCRSLEVQPIRVS